MQHHFVVYFDDVTKTWHIDEDTTDARFEDGNVWVEDKKKFLAGEWQDSNDTTSDALDNLIELIEIDSESNEPDEVDTWVCSQCHTDCSCITCPAEPDERDDDLIEETDYLEEEEDV